MSVPKACCEALEQCSDSGLKHSRLGEYYTHFAVALMGSIHSTYLSILSSRIKPWAP